MFFYLGKYVDWVGSYQIANSLQKIGVSEDRCEKIGDFLAETWLHKFLEWIHDKRKRTEIVDMGFSLLFVNLTQERDFRVSQYLYPVRMKVLRIAGQGQPRFLQARTANTVGKPLRSRDQLESQTVFLVLEEIFNGKVDGIQ